MGQYTLNLANINGCDSVVVLDLAISPSYHDTISATICLGDRYQNAGFDTIPEQAGLISYSQNLKTQLGCDSIITLNLTVNPIEITILHDTICRTGNYNNYNFNIVNPITDSYYDTLSTIYGCDSIVILNLTVHPLFNDTIYANIYDNESVLFGGKYYSLQGVYTDSLRTIFGCDSLSTLNLTTYLSFDAELLESNLICSDSPNFAIEFEESRGVANYYSLAFDTKAFAAGFSDVALAAFTNPIIINIPSNVRPDNYKVSITLENIDQYKREYPLEFMVRYPSSVMAQKWNDVVALYNSAYNGGYDYSAIQWYKNGNLLYGETHSYIYLDNNIFTTGDEYTALLTRIDDGESVFTCPLIVIVRALSTQVYPTILSAGETINIISPKAAKVSIYNSLGVLSNSQNIGEGNTTMISPNSHGFYFMIISDEEQVLHRQTIIVK